MIYDAPMLQAWTCDGWHRDWARTSAGTNRALAYRARATGLPRRLRHLTTASVYHRFFGWAWPRR
jgi:hypothetical protein